MTKTFCFGSIFYRPVSLATIIDNSLSCTDQLSARSSKVLVCMRATYDFTMATSYEHAHYMTKWLIGHTHSRCTHPYPPTVSYPDNTCHRRARSKMEWIYTRTKVSGHSSLELAQENRISERKKETLTNGYFFEHLVLAHTIELMDDLNLVR